MNGFSPILTQQGFNFDPNFNFGVTNVMGVQSENFIPPFPVPDEFLLLDSEFFLLLDGTNFLLLGS
jgi:hypothetical protein